MKRLCQQNALLNNKAIGLSQSDSKLKEEVKYQDNSLSFQK